MIPPPPPHTQPTTTVTSSTPNLDYIHNVELSQGEVATILYYIESYFQGSDENPEEDTDLMSVCRKLETLSPCE